MICVLCFILYFLYRYYFSLYPAILYFCIIIIIIINIIIIIIIIVVIDWFIHHAFIPRVPQWRFPGFRNWVSCLVINLHIYTRQMLYVDLCNFQPLLKH